MPRASNQGILLSNVRGNTGSPARGRASVWAPYSNLDYFGWRRGGATSKVEAAGAEF